MSKFTNLLLAGALVATASVTASARTLTVDIDDASRVTMKIAYQEVTDLKNGVNTWEIDEYEQCTIAPKAGYIFESITYGDGTEEGLYDNHWRTSEYWFGTYGSHESNYIVKTGDIAELSTGSFTLNIDDPSLVNVTLNPKTGQAVTGLQAGANTVKYIPDVDTYVNLSRKDGKPIYSVTNNGEASTPGSYGDYSVMFTEGGVIDVVTAYPDQDVTVSFTYVGNCEGVINGVFVNDEQVSDFDGKAVTVKCGDTVKFTGDSNNYRIDEVKVNGEKIYFYSSYYFTALKDMTVEVEGEKYAMINVTVDVDDASRVNVYKGAYQYDGNLLTIQNGTNTIEISTADPAVCVVPASNDYHIDSVTKNGEAVSPAYEGAKYYSVTKLADGDAVAVTSSEIERNSTIAFFASDIPSSYDFMVSNALRDYYYAEAGTNVYKVVKYDDATEIPFNLTYGVYGRTSYVYLNGEAVAPIYEGGNSLEIKPTENLSVVKCFLDNEPALQSVTFTVAANAADAFTATHDMIKPFDAADATLQCFPGTLFTLTPSEGRTIKVIVNDEPLAMNEDGSYSFSVTGATTVNVDSDDNVGVNGINADKTSFNIYNIQGIEMMRNASANDVNNLPAGMYIINGKKVVRK